ncbi:peptide chain release factor 2 [Candidatus Woesebacteria bacterium RIFCSPLOWO2_01_FULL_39_23]|uniref:Peptide chain release factor 2 n=1 Tax=Candidatus Woesebacteria bacterium RIFCSPHIGHO2_01_FULL_40_22 TaxID=1802499 RepID=A0A1F7YIT4_9BACT|nr:MAG: peptide chain release factor 2 [Candidatus Woesebacteria bacterium RBG_16_40_11]OGM26518.1 MAG: peptide chain release factor 2 [Candidatus Woesebacteria bacterium RIFCSPHIGHO2_01_FULL_40_22]OGM37682.1 MAG: peptide chain release factor 2 [Candidatus Woesebacteria bacterium RIFCSPHIGHO2_12_FULL_38_9]OGM62970.1 MAG: peptide chain release factor 2 [Candidatus Woesebacteria bacterium RIFCSPLOWO2_01_FULL_39_23]
MLMYDLKVKIETLAKDLSELKNTLKLDDKRLQIRELEAKSTDPSFWHDQQNARSVMQMIGNLRNEMDELDALTGEIDVLVSLSNAGQLSDDLEKDINQLESRVTKLKLKSFLSGTYDQRNALFSIHAGQGGTEAMDWANMLYRMYLRYCEKKGWAVQTIDVSEGEEAGIKSVTFKIEGAYAYGYLKGEAGTHRLVRQSPFNADKLRQTSFALVEVLPELAEMDLPDIQIKDEDVEWQFFRASSQGGQNVQKVSTAVRLKHIKSGIVVTAQTERFQEQNRRYAMDLLRAKLWAKEQEREDKERKDIKGEYHPASWGTQIRSYVLHPYKMVKDLRTGVETGNTEAVLNGELDEFIEAELKI